MEYLLHPLARGLADILSFGALLILAIGSAYGFWNLLTGWFSRRSATLVALTVWQGLSRWILVALQFMLAADLVETIASPDWDTLGRLGALALIRTLLGYFLGRDMEAARKIAEDEQQHAQHARQGG